MKKLFGWFLFRYLSALRMSCSLKMFVKKKKKEKKIEKKKEEREPSYIGSVVSVEDPSRVQEQGMSR